MNKKQTKGFSLVELLVAMVVGLIIISGAFSLHSTTRKTQMANETQMDMVADARFAIEMIAYDLRHAGMWGGTNKENFISCKSSETIACTQSSAGETLPADAAISGDCAIGWSYDLRRPIFATGNIETKPYSSTCLPGSEGLVGTADILEIRYADSNAILDTDLLAGQFYIRSNAVNGRIFAGATEPVIDAYNDSSLTHNHELKAYVYYISNHTDATGDGIPSLRRVALVNGPAMQNQTLLSGVSDLQVKFGEDVNGDGIADRYVHPVQVGDWANVYAVKIWLVMRSDKKQIGVDTSKTFFIAGAAKNLGGVDDYRYFMVTSVVNLRNMIQI
ncbi:MAG: PilW family protein [Gammaproteobacteria bacterium]|nr:PilW family protein [Gammaproteobacteria bacterium]